MLLRRFIAVIVVIRFVRMGRMLLRRFIAVVMILCRMDMGVIMIVFCIFHAFHNFLLHRVHIIHHSDNGHVGGIQGRQRLVQPVFHGAAVADEDIGMLDGADISRSWLKGMAVHPRRNDHLQVHLVSGNLTHKIIIGEQGYRHFQLSALFGRCIKSALVASRLCASTENQGYTKKRGCQACAKNMTAPRALFLPNNCV